MGKIEILIRLILSPLNIIISFFEGIGRYVEFMMSMFRSFFSWHKYLNLFDVSEF